MDIRQLEKQFVLPRYVAILVKRLNMEFQPNRKSSLYKRPTKNKILPGQEYWNCPVGTIRLSDHWNYTNSDEKLVFKTKIPVSKDTWVLCLNTGQKTQKPWKVLIQFKVKKGINIIRTIDFEKIQQEINSVLCTT